MSDSQPAASGEPSPEDQDSSKRKRQENGPQPRAKRSRYISIACNECKRRKIKCNGETPCQRCGNLNLECLYAPNCCSSNFKDSNEFKQMTAQIAYLQDQVDSLYQNISSLRSALGQQEFQQDQPLFDSNQSRAAAPLPTSMESRPYPRAPQSPQQPRFQGPTSSAFSFGVAKSSLQNMGITGADDEMFQENMTAPERPPADNIRGRDPMMHADKDPIWALSKDEALRLCNVYEEEMGVMYPVLDIEKVSHHANMLYTFVDAAAKSFMLKFMPGADGFYDQDTDILKVVLAIALVTENGGQSELGRKLFQSVAGNAETKLLGNVDLKCIQLLTMIAMYHFHSDDEGLSWRVIGLAARLCIELGLHRAETYPKLFQDDTDRSAAVRLFWSIYVLDRRWSLGTGMSFALQDQDIDPTLPKPDDSSPYLAAMVRYSQIGSSVWKSIANADPAGLNNVFSKDEISYLDYQIIQWQRALPESLRYIHPNSPEYAHHASDPNTAESRGMYRLRVLLHLRANQMRILIYRPVLHSATSILSPSSGQFAQTVTDVAKDTIRILTHINQTSNIYRNQQMLYNYFLTSALAVLFLAVSHAPAQFSESVREEFYMALDLVRGLSAHSHVSKRLWRTIRGLKEIGPKLGLYSRNGARKAPAGGGDAQPPPPPRHQRTPSGHQPRPDSAAAQQQYDAHSSAAMAMAGLAGHPVDESSFYAANANAHAPNNGSGSGPAASVTPSIASAASPNVMANDLTSLFEAAGGYVNNGAAGPAAGGANAFAGEAGSPGAVGAGAGDPLAGVGIAWGNEDEVNRIMKDLF